MSIYNIINNKLISNIINGHFDAIGSFITLFFIYMLGCYFTNRKTGFVHTTNTLIEILRLRHYLILVIYKHG